MPFLIVRNDITRVKCDAIVNAANNSLLGGGGVDGAIHRAAGPRLLAECRRLGGCETGQAKITKGYRLPAKYVIHTVGPIWRGGEASEAALLRSCYFSSLQLAVEYGCESVAFPLISAGAYGYPKAEALEIAQKSILAFLQAHELTVYLVVFDRTAFRLSAPLQQEIASFIDDAYSDRIAASQYRRQQAFRNAGIRAEPMSAAAKPSPMPTATAPTEPAPDSAAHRPAPKLQARREEAQALWEDTQSLEEAVSQLDESFQQMLLRKIDESGMTDAACYKKANVDRKLFSKIRKDVQYRPSKPTAVAFAIALELPLSETKELLGKAGYALSHSSRFDLIIEFFLQRRIYDVFQINEALFAYDQPLLGAC